MATILRRNLISVTEGPVIWMHTQAMRTAFLLRRFIRSFGAPWRLLEHLDRLDQTGHGAQPLKQRWINQLWERRFGMRIKIGSLPYSKFEAQTH